MQGTGAAGASAAQSGGILSQLFGGQVAANARQPAVTAPPTKELDVVDGQVVELEFAADPPEPRRSTQLSAR